LACGRAALQFCRGDRTRRSEVLAVAERLAAPVIKPLLGKGAIPDDYSLAALASLAFVLRG
jgi:pyruvate dehydrogenase (quinone)